MGQRHPLGPEATSTYILLRLQVHGVHLLWGAGLGSERSFGLHTCTLHAKTVLLVPLVYREARGR